MDQLIKSLDTLYNVCHIPLAVVRDDSTILASWPNQPEGIHPEMYQMVIQDFRLQKRDALHPLISFLGSGFFLGVAELTADTYLLTGLIPAHAQSRRAILAMLADIMHPSQLQTFCDYLLQMPIMTLHQLKEYMCLLVKLASGKEISSDDIFFVDILDTQPSEHSGLEQSLFNQREEAEFHIPPDFEDGICTAIEAGNRMQLEHCLATPYRGRVGRMSSNELFQQRYSFICIATLVSRAAIRGGLPPEIAFSLSDFYCQRNDLMTDVAQIQELTFTMLIDYCDRVSALQQKPAVSPVIEDCLSYISVHLHETITLPQLSSHCGLCGRSLSMRFKKEMGVSITEYIHQEKMQEAEYLLRHSGYTISEITSFLNYPSQSYFTQIFKSHHNMTPVQFRNQRNIKIG